MIGRRLAIVNGHTVSGGFPGHPVLLSTAKSKTQPYSS